MNTASTREALFLGLDSSTQGLKATVIDADSHLLFETGVQFDSDLPEFGTRNGVHHHPDGLTVTSPPLMWVTALDLLIMRMKEQKVRLASIAAVSGSGQQHGSVYLRPGADKVLRTLNPDLPLSKQLKTVFALEHSPVWMDSSTTRQCQERDAAVGGAQAMADLTGSRSYERFTGNQIAKLVQERPDVYRATDRIALVSSFMASLLIGDYAPIEPGDGAGMNLMDIRSRRWAEKALACTGPDLEVKLGPIVPSHSVIGPISSYYAVRYGFSQDCLVIAFSGDNPNSLAALRLENAGDIAISLGTSDTVFGALSDPKPSAAEGHIFGNPINPEGYMALMCYKNGSLTREAIRDEFAARSWEVFEQALDRTPVGNGGRIGFYFKEPEITPPVLSPGTHRFGPDNSPARNAAHIAAGGPARNAAPARNTSRSDAGRHIAAGGPARFTPEENVRAVVEGQFLSMRLHGQNIGLVPKTILATGGASVNKSLLRIIADVFGAPVHTGKQPNSASLGAAFRALHGWHCRRAGRFVAFGKAVKPVEPFVKTADPDTANHAIYTDMLTRYAELERRLT